jgi:hypothetical protein
VLLSLDRIGFAALVAPLFALVPPIRALEPLIDILYCTACYMSGKYALSKDHWLRATASCNGFLAFFVSCAPAHTRISGLAHLRPLFDAVLQPVFTDTFHGVVGATRRRVVDHR